VKVEHSVVIDRPVEDVFRYVTTYERHPEWRIETEQTEETSEGPTGVGSTGREVSRVLGRKIEADTVITEYEPGRRLMAETTSGPFPIRAGHVTEPVEQGTRYTFVVEGEPGGFFKLAEPILRRIVNRQVETNVMNLKDLMEAGADSEE
jgi:uncharacterized protein YndB with AHSA1/START domain